MQSACLIAYSTTAHTYEDSVDNICQLIPCTRCKNASAATLVVHFLRFRSSRQFFICFAYPVLSCNQVGHEIYKQVSHHSRCSACPRANLSYAIAKVRLPSLVFRNRRSKCNLSQLLHCWSRPVLPYIV